MVVFSTAGTTLLPVFLLFYSIFFSVLVSVLAVVVTLHCSLPQLLSIPLLDTLLASNENCKTIATAIIAASYVPLLLEFHRIHSAGCVAGAL